MLDHLDPPPAPEAEDGAIGLVVRVAGLRDRPATCLDDYAVAIREDQVGLAAVTVLELVHQWKQELVKDDLLRLPDARPRPFPGEDPAAIVRHGLAHRPDVADGH